MEVANEIMKQVVPILMIPINDYLRYIISCMKYVKGMWCYILSLRKLPNLKGLCHNVNIIELPQLVSLRLGSIPGFTSIYPGNNSERSSLLKEQVVIPKLEKLDINDMENLKEIWPCEFSMSDKVKLREIDVSTCDNLMHMFPCNPMHLLHHLEEINVYGCGSFGVKFDIDLDSIGEIGEASSSLRSIKVEQLGKLREVWRIKGADNSPLLFPGFQAVESIIIINCKSFKNVFTPVTTNFDLGALISMNIKDCGENRRNNELAESSQEQTDISEEDEKTKEESEEEEEEEEEEEKTEEGSEEEDETEEETEEETSQVSDSISNVVFPSSLIHSFHKLRELELSSYEGAETVFEIGSPTSRELVTIHHNQQELLPYLEELNLSYMDNMSHVWKCNRNKFLILQKQQPESSFHNLKTIHMYRCNRIKYLFSPLMAKLLSKLEKIEIDHCDGIREIASKRGGEDEDEVMSTSTHINSTLFPRLDSLTLNTLGNLNCIGGGGRAIRNVTSFTNSVTDTAFVDHFKVSQAGGVSWSLCQYSREIVIYACDALSTLIPCYAAGHMQKLQVLRIEWCDGMKEVFGTEGMNKDKGNGYDEGNGGTHGIPRLNNVVMLPNLKKLFINQCHLLEHLFPFSALESLRQLEKLTIWNCSEMKVIVQKEEDGGEKTNTTSSKKVVVFPRLKSIKLINIPELVGFFLGMNEFRWPSLDKVTIKRCPQMMVFASGGSTTPQLKHIHTSLGKYSLQECGLNFHATTVVHRQSPLLPILDSSSSCPATSKGISWPFHNLIEVKLNYKYDEKIIIPSNELLQLQNLEKIYVDYCEGVEEVFKAFEPGTDSSGLYESQTIVVKLPNLTEVKLWKLDGLRYIWKSNQWTIFEFPRLTSIDIRGCQKLKHVFSSSMVGSLLQLKELHVFNCKHMEEVIGKEASDVVEVEEEEESHGKMKEIMFPRLKSLSLYWLPCLKGFSLGKEDFSFPLLDTLEIRKCPAITMLSKGNLATPELKEIDTSFGSFYVGGEDINSFIKTKQKKFRED